MKTSRYVLYAGVVAALLVAALIVGLGLRDRTVQVAATPSPIAATSTPVPATTAPASPSPTAPHATASPAAVVPAGTITGRLDHGSDFIPPTTVYAISTVDQRVWYSVDLPGVGNPPLSTMPPGGLSYTITGVTPGTYWVVAYRTDRQSPVPAFYSRAVECLRARPSRPCPDHALAPVTVSPGQTTSGIDVLDAPPPSQPSYPPQPTPR